MTTYVQAVANAAQVLADARAHRDSLTPEAAAAEAYVPGGPSVDEIAALIRRHRAEARRRIAA
ncbi:hypothetical protein [Actinoallomurus iriomotensis]|uniref:Uncharacterized protein n=1 Tax=Actinoallomurus iriomotensis TaxID=478107 RepID=A0A9W6RU88_9ACTN|nr:hypothetical protein [Actinoallomurus iriomotensis]GLY81885.1 hypothetical protein Airi01_101520 [Actinoallomurus iriomotensis]